MRRVMMGLAVLVALAGWMVPAGAQAPMTVFAAASLTDALRALAAEWQERGNPAPRLSFAASSALARQVEQGAPADLFMSADEAWMDYLQQRGLIVEATRVSAVGNALVLVAPASAQGADAPAGARGAGGPAGARRHGSPAGGTQPVALHRGTDLAALLPPGGRIATGDPAHVPVGRYAEAALRWMGQWDALGPRLARADNVRAALLLVERGEAPLGIVYATDAAASRGVRVVGTFPPGSHPAVTYPFALLRRAEGNAQARGFLAFVTGPEAAATWQRLGFALAR
jgi:molybdate transport system substrate-binding protein